MEPNAEVLHSIFHHVVLPPQIPGEQDPDLSVVSHGLLERLISACESFQAAASWAKPIQAVHSSLVRCRLLNNGRLDKQSILQAFREIQPSEVIILHIVEQNAGLFVRRNESDNQLVIFEAFEASAPAENVLASQQRLQWDFPGRSAQLPLVDFLDESFQEQLAIFLEKASMESLYMLQAHASKANVSVTEYRDVTDPGLITEMLIPILESMGDHFSGPTLPKMVRDDVNFGTGAKLPWRRLPFWLILRVAVQRQLSIILGRKRGRFGYKFIMCIMMAKLLRDVAGVLRPDFVITLRTKLCRRMAKLEKERGEGTLSKAENCDNLFDQFCPMIEDAIKYSSAQIERVWNSFKLRTTRHIPPLQRHALSHDLQLSLPNSGQFLDTLLSSSARPEADPVAFDLPQPLSKSIQQVQDFTDRAFRVASIEREVRETTQDLEFGSPKSSYVHIAQKIQDVMDGLRDVYQDDPEQMSQTILTIMSLWKCLDKSAIQNYPLLRDYQPVFRPEILDVLQLPRLSDMERLQEIQTYLHERQSRANLDTIFKQLDKRCLAARYVSQSGDGGRLQSLRSRIQSASDNARNLKEKEWEKACESYDSHTQGIQEGTCCCSFSEDGKRDVRGCKKCWLWRCRSRLQIECFESLLPEAEPARSTVVFELAIPKHLSIYREATWQILITLAYPSRRKQSPNPLITLASSPLKKYMEKRAELTLGSQVKAFKQTHYKFKSGKVPLSHVLVPFAAKMQLYDPSTKVWVGDLDMPPTFQHLCGIQYPLELKDTVFVERKNQPPGFRGPSSYEIQANQTMCPSDVYVHEFTAYQKLLSGSSRRWPNILVELGSSNLNCSNENTTRLVCQLAVQAGPSPSGSIFRTPHAVFDEPKFLERLSERIETRLSAIKLNWREHTCMELLVTLSLRILSLGSGVARERAEGLLRSSRNALIQWQSLLRKEVRNYTSADAAQRIATYGFHAALICRKTFAIHAETSRAMSAEDLALWVQASLSLQENLMIDVNQLPDALKTKLFRDAKLACELEPIIRAAVKLHGTSIGRGVIAVNFGSSGSHTREFESWTYLASPNGRWLVATTHETLGWVSRKQTVHFNIIEGHFLIDGKTRGRLPLEITEDPIVKDLFGDKYLLTYPSSLPGMTHRLSTPIEGQEVHFGLREGSVIVRTVSNGVIYEHVPRRLFSGPESFDLPMELMDNCTHWVNFSTKYLEVRRGPDASKWILRPRDWIIDIPCRKACRGNVMLVSPQSGLSKEIFKIFQDFERPERLTIYQPRSGGMSVDLRHLELSFVVNRDKLLECRQLKAELDPDQDCGTWYGLQSKLIFRDVITKQRSVLIPLGKTTYARNGIHVATHIDDAHVYGRYYIDKVLGRLTCAPEPRLLYMKALCHATTSFCLVDPLTGRSGMEEAIDILQSGTAQPWNPLPTHVNTILESLATLAPRREYYPPTMKRLQRVTWNPNLTATTQHDSLENIVHDIIDRSHRLGVFNNLGDRYQEPEKPSMLRIRGELSRQLYEKPIQDTAKLAPNVDFYSPRDRGSTKRASRVHEIAQLVLGGCRIEMQTELRDILDSWQTVSGFHEDSDDDLIDDSHYSYHSLISQVEDPMKDQWGELVNFCRYVGADFPVALRLGLLAFGSDPSVNSMDAIRALSGFASIDELLELEPAEADIFVNVESWGRPSCELLRGLIASNGDALRTTSQRRRRALKGSAPRGPRRTPEEEIEDLAQHLLAQWPVPAHELSEEGWEASRIDFDVAVEKMSFEWDRRIANEKLAQYVAKVQDLLDSSLGQQPPSKLPEWKRPVTKLSGKEQQRHVPSISLDLAVKPAQTFTPAAYGALPSLPSTVLSVSPRKSENIKEILELRNLLLSVAHQNNPLRRQYGSDLLQSLYAFQRIDKALRFDLNWTDSALNAVRRAMEKTRTLVHLSLTTILDALSKDDGRAKWLSYGSLWPCTTTTETLSLLRSVSHIKFGPGMKEAIVQLGLTLTSLQKFERIQNALMLQDERILVEELRNPGHQNWDPLEYPDWLLMEIDCNFLIRATQVEVAKAIIWPSRGTNSVLQMNMGEGKSSCIVPMAVAVLADGNRLSRLIVPKALLMQTAQTTQSRIGGLVGRSICQIPFSRKTPTTPEMLDLYMELHRSIRGTNGLILTCHEHVLSFKLGGWQYLADGNLMTASNMINFQKWLDRFSRDILDECDFTLSVKTQLNYPSGPELAIDGHPFRWEVAESLLGFVARYAPSLKRTFPSSIEVLGRPGIFPTLHFLKDDAEKALRARIVADICFGRTPFLRLASPSISPQQTVIVAQVLCDSELNPELFGHAAACFANPQVAAKILLTVRGLMMNNILLICLGKRWNVKYGLHPGRAPVAVPFEAKGVPSEQAEFGHPDVAILLTCLAFYYAGLNYMQFRQGLQQVLQSDDPAAQYERWISSGGALPKSLHSWSVINTEDEGQTKQLWGHLRYSKSVIDHYMNAFVFPTHARQFEVKLQASAWDLISMSPYEGMDLHQNSARTSGFSGTNDNRMMLPLSIKQDDLSSLQHTSAEVLSYLLQSRNREYRVTTDREGLRLNEEGLLRIFPYHSIRVLIDAGAFILEMDNTTLVKTWLTIDTQAKAAVYFGADNRAWVCFRGEKNDVPLIASPFADDLSDILIYIDQAHCIGVDLKLPFDARGALTLALRQEKDSIVQAAMRLRQLSTTQSVTFFAPPEVDQSIRDTCQIRPSAEIRSPQVISWLLEQSCLANEQLQGLYAAQGLDFCRRTDAIWHHADFQNSKKSRAKLLEQLRQPERQTLEQLYGSALLQNGGPTSSRRLYHPELRAFAERLNSVGVQRDTGTIMGAMEEVEQEREVHVQVEQVRQTQRPVRHEAWTFNGQLHPDIVHFAKTGNLIAGSGGFEHAFDYLGRTSLGKRLGVRSTGSKLFVSKEFGRTIKNGNERHVADDFVRPVEWILGNIKTQTFLVIIPEEAELLIPQQRRTSAQSPPVHLIAYAAIVTKAMLSLFSRLQYYSVPPLPERFEFESWFRIELGILSGQLYVNEAEWDVWAGFLRDDGKVSVQTKNFAKDRVAFLLEWLSVKRKTQGILETPVGQICMGRSS